MNRIKQLREARGISGQKLADLLGTSRGQIYQLEKGLRGLDTGWMHRIARALDCRPEDIISEGPNKIPIKGTIHQGGSVSDFAVAEKRYAELPPGVAYKANLVSREVESDLPELGLYKSYLIYYYEANEAKPHSLVSMTPYIVGLKDGTVLVRLIRRGSTPGRYMLVLGSNIIEDAELAWCAKIKATVYPD